MLVASILCIFNPLPNNKILGLPKLKAIADDKLNVTKNVKVVFRRIENIVGKEENAGNQHFLLFPQCFQKALSSSASKVINVWLWVNQTCKFKDYKNSNIVDLGINLFNIKRYEKDSQIPNTCLLITTLFTIQEVHDGPGSLT